MSKQTIALGTTDNDNTGDGLKAGGGKINSNFTELYNRAVASTSDPTVNDDGADGYQAGYTTWFNTRTRNLFILTDSTTGAAVWQCLNPDRVRLTVNDFYTPIPQDYITTGLCAANKLRGIMFQVPQRMTVDQMGILNNAAASGVNFKAGIWAVSGLLPTGNPLVTIASTSANASRPIASFVSSATLTFDPALWYFYADVHDGTFDKLSNQSIMTRFMGVTNSVYLTQGAGNRGFHYSQAHTYANALPDLTTNSLAPVAALTGSEGPGVPYFRVSNVSPT